jgi:hypothetical protein
MQSEMDVLVLEDCVLHKSEQRPGFKPWADDGCVGDPGRPDPDSPWADPVTGEPLVMTPTGATNLSRRGGISRLFVSDERAAPGRTSRMS